MASSIKTTYFQNKYVNIDLRYIILDLVCWEGGALKPIASYLLKVVSLYNFHHLEVN